MSTAIWSTPGKGITVRLLFLDHAGVLGGAELSLLDIARHHRNTSEVVLFSDGPFRTTLEQAGVTVTVLPVPERLLEVNRADGWRSLAALPAIPQVLRALAPFVRQADLVHCNSQKAFALGALAASVSRRPVVWHLRDILTADHFSAANRRVAVTLANTFATKVIANSQATAQAFIDAGGRRDLPVVVYNGIDPDAFEDLTPATARQAAGLDLEGFVVGAFSRLAPWKGQHVLLESLAQLPGTHALIVGDALFGETAYEARLHAMTRSLDLERRVHFLGFRRDVPTLMAACDAIVHTSVAPEPFGRMIVEAQLARRPIIATRAGGAVELIEDGETGWLVPPGDAGKLASCLSHMLTAPAERRAISQKARDAASRLFTRNAMLDAFRDVVEATRRAPT